MSSCCSPSNEPSPRPDQAIVSADEVDVDLVDRPGGEFWMGAPDGDGYADDGEGQGDVHL